MGEILLDLSERALVAAIERNLAELHVFMAGWPEITVHRAPDLLWTLSRRKFSLCNVVLDVRFESPGLDARIAEAMRPYGAAGVNVMWKLGPSTRPEDLGDHLEPHGLSRLPALRGMAADLAAPVPTRLAVDGVTVHEVTDATSLDQWQAAVTRGFGWPSFGAATLAENLAYLGFDGDARAFVALRDARPVGSSLVFFGAGVAGIYHVSTVPEERRRGTGAAVTTAALLEARRLGYRAAVLHATEMGYPVYRRLGFAELCRIGMYRRLVT